MDGRAIYDYQIRELEGKLLTLIEGVGLGEKQDKAVKDMFRDIFYRAMYQETPLIAGEPLQFALNETRRQGIGSLVSY